MEIFEISNDPIGNIISLIFGIITGAILMSAYNKLNQKEQNNE